MVVNFSEKFQNMTSDQEKMLLEKNYSKIKNSHATFYGIIYMSLKLQVHVALQVATCTVQIWVQMNKFP